MSERYTLSALGLVSPLGAGKQATLEAMFAGSRAGLVSSPDWFPDRSVPVGAVTAPLPTISTALAAFDCRNNRLMLAALAEIADDIAAAIDRYGVDRVAVVMGTSTSGIAEAEQAMATRSRTGSWPNDFSYRMQEIGNLSGFVSRHLGVTGPAYTIATACSSSGKTLAAARRLMRTGLCDAAIVGGADSLCRMTLSGFDSLEALSDTLCNPFSANRTGINIGEGAVAFLMTREDGPIQVLGVGESSDAYHASAPEPEGRGAFASMQAALSQAGLSPGDIDYLNLHGTATVLNDAAEARAVHRLFGSGLACSSTKAMTGHMLGTCGAVEAAFLWLAMHPDHADGRLPPHLWDGVPDPDLPALNLVPPGTKRPDRARAAMLSNSFAFGGSNVSVLLGTGWAAN